MILFGMKPLVVEEITPNSGHVPPDPSPYASSPEALYLVPEDHGTEPVHCPSVSVSSSPNLLLNWCRKCMGYRPSSIPHTKHDPEWDNLIYKN